MSQPEKDALRFHMHELRTFAHPISPGERTGKGQGEGHLAVTMDSSA